MGVAASSRQLSKNESCSRPLRAAESEGEISSLLSTVLADVSECMVDELAEGISQYVGGGRRTCRGEEDDEGEVVEAIVMGSASFERAIAPPRSSRDAISGQAL